MAKFKSKKELDYEDEEVYVKSNRRKTNQYDKCKNYDCEENDNGFCMKYKNRAKHTCKNFR